MGWTTLGRVYQRFRLEVFASVYRSKAQAAPFKFSVNNENQLKLSSPIVGDFVHLV